MGGRAGCALAELGFIGVGQSIPRRVTGQRATWHIPSLYRSAADQKSDEMVTGVFHVARGDQRAEAFSGPANTPIER